MGAQTALKLRRVRANRSSGDAAQPQKATNPVSSDPLRK